MTTYILIDRENHPDVAVRYGDAETAQRALTEDPLIDSLCEEDALDAYVTDPMHEVDLEGREIIDPDDFGWIEIGGPELREDQAEVYVINERPLTDDTLAIAPEGHVFRGGYAAILIYHTFAGPWSDEEHVRRFRTMGAAERFIEKRYGKPWTDLVSDLADEWETQEGDIDVWIPETTN